MKTQYINRYLAIGAVFVAFGAHGASVPDIMKKQTADQCVQMRGGISKYAPTEASKLPSYCACVGEHYWSNVPQSDYDGIVAEAQAQNFAGPRTRAASAHATEHYQAAEKTCSGN